MRNFKIKRTKPIFISKAAFVNVTLLAGIVIFVALAVLTGRLVSDNIFTDTDVDVGGKGDIVDVTMPTPTPAGQTPDNTKLPEGTVSNVIKLEGKDYYFVQFGVFSSGDNAKTCANSIASMGGAGYIKETNGKFYVFAMCYSNGNDAKTVVTNLQSQGYSTLLKCFSHGGLTLNVSASKENITKIETAYSGIVQATDELESIIYKFDKGEIDRTELKNQLRTLLAKINANKNTFAEYETQNKIFADAKALCDEFYADITETLKLESDMQLRSATKNVYITNVFGLIEYLDNAVVE